jgi:hypothetical protein
MQGGSTAQNPIVVVANNRIDEMRVNIKENLKRLNETLKIRKSDLEKQSNLVSGKISQIPRQEREFKIIDREQKIIES